MNNVLSGSVFGILLLTSFAAQAQVTEPQIGNVRLEGSACPQDKVEVVYSPDRKVISLLFKNLTLNATPAQPRITEQCIAEIPIHVPQFRRVSISSFDHRGGVILGRGGSLAITLSNNFSVLASRGRFSGWSAESVHTFQYPFNDLLNLRQTVFFNSMNRGRLNRPRFDCGQSVMLRLKTAYDLRTGDEDSLLQLDSIDGGLGSLSYALDVEPCRQ